MSTSQMDILDTDDEPDTDVWQQLAERRDALEMCVDEDLPFAERAERLLERLDKEGY